MGSVNFSSIDIPENSFETENNISFDSSKLNLNYQEKKIMSMAVVKMLKKISDLSNCNIIKNANVLLLSKNVDFDVEWVGKTKQRLPQIKYKMFY